MHTDDGGTQFRDGTLFDPDYEPTDIDHWWHSPSSSYQVELAKSPLARHNLIYTLNKSFKQLNDFSVIMLPWNTYATETLPWDITVKSQFWVYSV